MHGTSGLSWKKTTDSTGTQLSLASSYTRVLALLCSFLLFSKRKQQYPCLGSRKLQMKLLRLEKITRVINIAVVIDLAVCWQQAWTKSSLAFPQFSSWVGSAFKRNCWLLPTSQLRLVQVEHLFCHTALLLQCWKSNKLAECLGQIEHRNKMSSCTQLPVSERIWLS